MTHNPYQIFYKIYEFNSTLVASDLSSMITNLLGLKPSQWPKKSYVHFRAKKFKLSTTNIYYSQ